MLRSGQLALRRLDARIGEIPVSSRDPDAKLLSFLLAIGVHGIKDNLLLVRRGHHLHDIQVGKLFAYIIGKKARQGQHIFPGRAAPVKHGCGIEAAWIVHKEGLELSLVPFACLPSLRHIENKRRLFGHEFLHRFSGCFCSLLPWDGVAAIARNRTREIAVTLFMIVFHLRSKSYHKLRNFQEKNAGLIFRELTRFDTNTQIPDATLQKKIDKKMDGIYFLHEGQTLSDQGAESLRDLVLGVLNR